MSIPAFFLGLILSTLYGALFHLWRGGNAGRLFLYLVLAWVGFWLGQLIAGYLKLSFDLVGQIHIFFSTLGSLAFLAIGYWLSLVQVEPKTK
jgi:hypothetical protein